MDLAVDLLCRCLFLSLYLSLVSTSHLSFTSSPTVIKPLVTDALTLRCALTDDPKLVIIGKRDDVNVGQDKSEDISHQQDEPVIPAPSAKPNSISFVHSIVISMNGNTVATVTEHVNATVYDKKSGVTEATGHIPGGGITEKGFLKVTWKYPLPEQSGTYQCTVTGSDSLGNIQTFTDTIEITDSGLTMNQMIGYIQDLKLTNAQLSSTVSLHTSTIANSTAELDYLREVVANQSARISDLTNQNAEEDKALAELQDRQNTSVVFSAYLDQSVVLDSSKTVIFDQTIVNTGAGYNSSTGIFTCPVSGYYKLDVTVMGQDDRRVSVKILLNGDILFKTLVEDYQDYQSSSAAVNVMLKQGDRIRIATSDKSYLFGSVVGKYCTFSGHLINMI